MVNKNNQRVKLADGLTEIGMSQVKKEASGLKLEDIYNVATLKKEDFMQSSELQDNVYVVTNEDVVEGIKRIIGAAEGASSVPHLNNIKFRIDMKNNSYTLSNTDIYYINYVTPISYYPIYTGFVIEVTSENSAEIHFRFGDYTLNIIFSTEATMEEGTLYADFVMNSLTLNGEQIAEGNDVFDYIESISMLY